MKKLVQLILVIILVVSFGHPPVVVGQSQAGNSALGLGGETANSDLLWGLNQFPYKHPRSPGYIRATVQGWAEGLQVTERSSVYDSIFLTLVTADRQNLKIQVVGPELELAFFKHELRPQIGKYKFWSAVLEFRGKYNDWVYDWYEFDLVGRFFIEWSGKSPNSIVGWQNEVYN